MLKKKLTITLLLLPLLALGSKQQIFINGMLPAIKQANQQILQDHQHLVLLYKEYQLNPKVLSKQDQSWLTVVAQNYDVENFSAENEQQWVELIKRVDIVPISLALAQAINESSWGESRFAKQANNYYGQWCYQASCGIVPEKRPNGDFYEVKYFTDRFQSVATYMHNLNTHASYSHFRNIRYELREKGQPLNGYVLVTAINGYAPHQSDYISQLQQLITRYQLYQYGSFN